jgi:steroid delta-isomerase-like uncharacterized protein
MVVVMAKSLIRTPAYSITEVEVLDPDGARRYAELTGAAVDEHGGRFLVLAAEPVVAEGEFPVERRVVVIEWPDMDALRTWYDSPEYAPARAIAATALRRQLIFVPGLDPLAHHSGGRSDRRDVEAMVRRFYEGMSTGETAFADELIAAEYEDIPVMPGTGGGPEGYRRTVAFLRTAFPDLTMTIEDIVIAGDRVAVRSTARGTHAGDFLGVSATGRHVEFAAFDFHLVADGRFRTSWHLEDNFGLLARIRPDGGA